MVRRYEEPIEVREGGDDRPLGPGRCAGARARTPSSGVAGSTSCGPCSTTGRSAGRGGETPVSARAATSSGMPGSDRSGGSRPARAGLPGSGSMTWRADRPPASGGSCGSRTDGGDGGDRTIPSSTSGHAPPRPRPRLDLLDRSRHSPARGLPEPAVAQRYQQAQLAALRAAAALVAARIAVPPATGQAGPRSLWDLLPSVAPELTEWAGFFERRPASASPTHDHTLARPTTCSARPRPSSTWSAGPGPAGTGPHDHVLVPRPDQPTQPRGTG